MKKKRRSPALAYQKAQKKFLQRRARQVSKNLEMDPPPGAIDSFRKENEKFLQRVAQQIFRNLAEDPNLLHNVVRHLEDFHNCGICADLHKFLTKE